MNVTSGRGEGEQRRSSKKKNLAAENLRLERNTGRTMEGRFAWYSIEGRGCKVRGVPIEFAMPLFHLIR